MSATRSRRAASDGSSTTSAATNCARILWASAPDSHVPTARELLEEVDALMRRNRAGAEPAAASIPAHHSDDLPVTVILPQTDGDMTHEAVEEALAPAVL